MSSSVPQVLRCCSEFVERHGVVDGIYRLSGVSSNIQKLRCVLNLRSTKTRSLNLFFQTSHSSLYDCEQMSSCDLFKMIQSEFRPTRSEFESDGTPDLNKDVYLQDIHCVSSLCKAYFRELPNPLLTYQLYDKFAVSVKPLTLCSRWARELQTCLCSRAGGRGHPAGGREAGEDQRRAEGAAGAESQVRFHNDTTFSAEFSCGGGLLPRLRRGESEESE